MQFCEGKGTPFEKLYVYNALTLLLGVGFDRCTSLHYAESLVPGRRTAMSRFPIMREGQRVWTEQLDMAGDNGRHFPVVGARFVETVHVHQGRIGDAPAMLFSTRELVDFAEAYFLKELGSDH
jgi:aminoglycoside 3-N-acetyltransferase